MTALVPFIALFLWFLWERVDDLEAENEALKKRIDEIHPEIK